MNKETLFELLDIESGDDFEYFENFADLVESSEDIDSEIIYELLEEIDLNNFGDLCENYFDEVLENTPDDQTEVFLLLTNIKNAIMGMASAAIDADEENVLVKLADEVANFKVWYCEESRVECKNESTGEITYMPVRDALVLNKLEKLGEQSYLYDFSESLDYSLDEYVMTFADIQAEEAEE